MNDVSIPLMPLMPFLCSANIIIFFVRNEFYPHTYIYQFRVYIFELGGIGVKFKLPSHLHQKQNLPPSLLMCKYIP
jgi:hypothetical protein